MMNLPLHFKKPISWIGLILMWPVMLQAAAPEAPEPLERSRALSMAVSGHPRMRVYAHRHDQAMERITQARSGFLPQLSFSERYSQTNNPMWAFGTMLNQESITQNDFDPARLNDPDGIDNFVGSFSVQWPLFDSGRTWYGWRQARQGAEVSELDMEKTKQQVVAGAAVAYDSLLLATAHSQVIDQAMLLAEAHLRMVTERFQAGFVVKSDLLRAQVRLAELKQKRYAAQSRVAVAIAALNAAMGEPPHENYEPSDDLVMTACKSQVIEDWIHTALSKRPELLQLDKQASIAEKEIAKQKAAHLPSLGLFGNYEINSESLDESATNYTVGAMVQVNLFSGYRDVAKTREARAALEEINAQRLDLVAHIEVQARQAYYEACSAKERIGVTEFAVSLAEENRRIVADRYKNGLLTIVELLDSETALEEARINRYQALYDYRVAYVNLQLAAGLVPSDL